MKGKLSLMLFFIGCLFLTGCSKQPYEIVSENILKVAEHDIFLTESKYDEYISDLDNWAAGDAYDELVELPDSLQEILEDEEAEEVAKIESSIEVDGINVYACFKDVDLEEFSDFYLFESEEYMDGSGDSEYGSSQTTKEINSEWDKQLIKWFNPNKEHDVRKAECFIGYGYYTLTMDGTEYQYYLAVKCNKEGKVEKFINNYLTSY